MFRKLIRALPGHEKSEKYSYEVIMFNDVNGSFKKEVVKAPDTHMRVEDPTKSKYEIFTGGGHAETLDNWKLISEEDFRKLKSDWDSWRLEQGMDARDDDGNPTNKESSGGTMNAQSRWIFDLIAKNSDLDKSKTYEGINKEFGDWEAWYENNTWKVHWFGERNGEEEEDLVEDVVEVDEKDLRKDLDEKIDELDKNKQEENK